MLGAIDGSLVPIIAPSENEPVYVSRKGYHAINVQGIMNAELVFTNVVARWPGSAHDSFILLNSAVYTNFETGQYADGRLLGDCGYSCKPWLLIPKLNPQTRAERAYNMVSCAKLVCQACVPSLILQKRFLLFCWAFIQDTLQVALYIGKLSLVSKDIE